VKSILDAGLMDPELDEGTRGKENRNDWIFWLKGYHWNHAH